MTDINEIKRELEALTAKVAAYEAAKARNWPERIEAGMVFGISEGGMECQYIASDASRLVCIASNTPGMIGGEWDSESLFRGSEDRFAYLGHARDILTIRTGAHEPTGAELVGKVCEFSDDGVKWESSGECERFKADDTFPYKRRGGFVWRFARLAK